MQDMALPFDPTSGSKYSDTAAPPRTIEVQSNGETLGKHCGLAGDHIVLLAFYGI